MVPTPCPINRLWGRRCDDVRPEDHHRRGGRRAGQRMPTQPNAGRRIATPHLHRPIPAGGCPTISAAPQPPWRWRLRLVLSRPQRHAAVSWARRRGAAPTSRARGAMSARRSPARSRGRARCRGAALADRGDSSGAATHDPADHHAPARLAGAGRGGGAGLAQH